MIDYMGGNGLKKNEALHVAESLFHDHNPANRHGFASRWIYRHYEQEGFGATMDPGERPQGNFRFNMMSDLAKAHQETSREQSRGVKHHAHCCFKARRTGGKRR